MTQAPAGPPAFPSLKERKEIRAREKTFLAALKVEAKARGWRYTGGFVFRQDGDWFALTMPGLRRDGGVGLALELKPMALDSLFWEIVGLQENEALPLSIRANGAWVLEAPDASTGIVGEGVAEPDALARLAMDWADDALRRSRGKRSVEQMLAALSAEPDLMGKRLALAICLHLLSGNLDAALALCQPSSPEHTFLDEAGGFLTSAPDGTFMTFLDQARVWIAGKRRAALKLA